MIRLLLVDDHQIFREALRSLLERLPGIDVVGETGKGEEVLPLVDSLQPDIVCMDIGLSGMNGIATTRMVLAKFPKVKVIALSTHADSIYVNDMFKAGAKAYVTKAEGGHELERAINEVSKGRTYCSPAAMMSSQGAPLEDPVLASRELQVLRLVAMGNSSIEIAAELNIAVGTVDVHRRNIMRKLNLHSAVELTRYAFSRNLLAE